MKLADCHPLAPCIAICSRLQLQRPPKWVRRCIDANILRDALAIYLVRQSYIESVFGFLMLRDTLPWRPKVYILPPGLLQKLSSKCHWGRRKVNSIVAKTGTGW